MRCKNYRATSYTVVLWRGHGWRLKVGKYEKRKKKSKTLADNLRGALHLEREFCQDQYDS